MSSSLISSSSSEADRAVALVASGNDMLVRMADVHCSVDFIIGTGVLRVEECLRLGPQGVIPLAQSAGADLRVEVHGITVATGEIVIIDDRVALRISRVSPPEGTETT
jgi:flagellar motor switch protein FliN/FliY